MKNIIFENWINELEGYSLKSERAYNELVVYPDEDHFTKKQKWNVICKWLKAAFEDGYSHGMESNEQEPIAWAVLQTDSYQVFISYNQALIHREDCAGGDIVPLYTKK
jgi:hypothetical protein